MKKRKFEHTTRQDSQAGLAAFGKGVQLISGDAYAESKNSPESTCQVINGFLICNQELTQVTETKVLSSWILTECIPYPFN